MGFEPRFVRKIGRPTVVLRRSVPRNPKWLQSPVAALADGVPIVH